MMDPTDLAPSAALGLECECRFRANLKALRSADQAASAASVESMTAGAAPRPLADLARSTPLVVSYLARGGDGSVACRIETWDGARRWVGGSVVPKAAIGQMLDGLDLPGYGHIFLAPFDGGHSLNALLAATHQHQRIFVLEGDVELFAATLMVADVREALRSGRVHLFVGDELAGRVAAYLEAHPWQSVPRHLITTSTCPDVVDFYRAEVDTLMDLVSGRRRSERGRRLDDAA